MSRSIINQSHSSKFQRILEYNMVNKNQVQNLLLDLLFMAKLNKNVQIGAKKLYNVHTNERPCVVDYSYSYQKVDIIEIKLN